MFENKFFIRISRQFLKYKFLFLVMVGMSLPLPIISYFISTDKINKSIEMLKEGNISQVSIQSQIETYIPNVYGIEYEKRLFPTVLRRQISIEEDVKRVMGFLESLENTSYTPQNVRILYRIPKLLITNYLFKFFSETIVIESNKLPEDILRNSNIVVIFEDSFYTPRNIIFVPVDSVEKISQAIDRSLGRFIFPPLREALVYVIANALVPNASFDPIVQEKYFKEYLKSKGVSRNVKLKKGEEIVKKGEILEKEDINLVKMYYNEVKARAIIRTIFLEIIIVLLAFFSILILSVFKDIRHPNILVINSGILLSSLYPQLFLKESIGDTTSIVSLFVSFLFINSLISGRKSTLVVGMYYILIMLLNISQGYLIIIHWVSMVIVISVMAFRVKRRSDFITISLLVLVIIFVLYLLLHYIENLEWGNVMNTFIISFITVFTNIFLIFMLLPIYEYFFRVATPFKLYELSSLDNPLLKELLEKAPGTYYHSLNVSILAEACAESIGANSLLAKVGSLYHDIGKINDADYFTENIGGRTREDIDPYRYTEIIKKHPIRGQEIAKKHRLPIEIERIILEHHGSGVISYFYNKASRENPNADIKFFKYSTPQPSSKESAIVFICDKIEAKIRSLTSDESVDIKSLENEVENTIYSNIILGELSKSDITLSDIARIKDSLKQNIGYILHQRIRYQR